MRLRRLLGSVMLLIGFVVGSPFDARAEPADLIRVGTVALRPCDLGIAGGRTWCGAVRVPLDYTDPGAASITIGFGWHPATSVDGGTVVAQEGGPGYPSTGTAADYAAMLGPLTAERNLLVVDARGTGRSTPLDCEPLQSLDPLAPNARFERAVAACGAQLDHTFRSRAGGFVHASDLFTTANSARDLARVLGALRQGRVDLYGDSYGTYFAQSFLSRYPRLLRSVVLDSAYEARDLDPWYRTTVTTARRSFDAVCAEAAACRQVTGSRASRSWSRISALARRLRTHPVTVTAPGVNDRPTRVHLDVTALVNIVNDAGYDPDPYRQLDAAARAYLDHDPTPLARLYAQDIGYDYSDYRARAAYYSDGLYLAVACTDYPQLFDPRANPSARRTQLDRAIRTLPGTTFAPFTTREWLAVLPYTETYTGCLSWPEPTHPPDPPVPTGASMDATHVPVLILNGALDSLTPAAGGAHIQRQIGSAARHIVVPGMVHLVGLDDRYGCGSSLVRQFLRRHDWRDLDTSCLARVPEIHAVGSFPRTVAAAVPASGPASVTLREAPMTLREAPMTLREAPMTLREAPMTLREAPMTLRQAPMTLRRQAQVALAAVGDAAIRYDYVDGSRDVGLRGGRVSYRADDAAGTVTGTLHAVRWTSDATVDGRVTADAAALTASAVVTLTPAHGRPVTFRIRWRTRGPGARATIVTGAAPAIRLSAPAP